jgi:hypothetical protein
VNVPKYDEDINDKTKKNKVLLKNPDLNDLAYTELILLIDVRSSNGKVKGSIINCCKNK